MKISKRTRAEAILIASVRSCDDQSNRRALCEAVAEDLGASHDARQLAWSAYLAAGDAIEENFDPTDWAEAAALLRGDDTYEPWSPGDPVRLLKES